MDKYLRQLQAMMAVVDARTSLILSGTGDVVEPENGLIGVGSGGPYALAAARALVDSDLSAEEIARRAMKIAAELCIYTNDSITLESIATA
jgi:ATP-dependent HslUV protease subunit HslV